MDMTQGEKMVWAAAFVADLEWIRNNPRLMPGLTPGQTVDGSYRHSIRHANGTVKRLREAAIKLRDDEEVDDQMLRAMLGDDVREREAADLLVRVKNYFCAQQVCTPEAIREMKSELGSDIDTWLRDEKGK